METITAAMIAYCVVFAGLVLGITVYRGIKRKREMQAFAGEMRAASAAGSTSPPQSPAHTDSPHHTPSAKHAA